MNLVARAFESVLEVIGENSRLLANQQLTGFVGLRGIKSDSGLVLVGRAVNGWTQEWSAEEARHSECRKQILAELIPQVIPKTGQSVCPMGWVADQWQTTESYNTARSAFWRCARGVVTGLSLCNAWDCDWPSYLYWTNLYKVSPSGGGNPSDTLCAIQHAACRELLNAELAASASHRVLFATGLGWAYPFLPTVKSGAFADSAQNHVAFQGKLKLSTGRIVDAVVACHPQRRNETSWVGEVCEAFRALVENQR